MRNCEEKEERLMLLESWRSFEDEFGTVSDKERVDKLMPEKVKKRRKVQADDGVRTQPLELVLSCQPSRNAPMLNPHFLWHVYSLRMGRDRAVWLLWRHSRVYGPRGGGGRCWGSGWHGHQRVLAKASGWRSIPGTMRNVVFLEHQQAGRVEGVETEPLGRSQSREGCVGCRRALMQLGLLQAKLTGLLGGGSFGGYSKQSRWWWSWNQSDLEEAESVPNWRWKWRQGIRLIRFMASLLGKY